MVNFNTKLRDVDRSSRKDFLAINEQVELFNGGFKLDGLKTKDTFRLECIRIWFLDVYAKDIAILALDGNKGYLGKSFNLGDLSLRAEMLSVLLWGSIKM
jgi:hypothetical protein